MFAVTLLAAALAFAQQPTETPKKARIEGKAVHAITGEPIRKASISLNGASAGRQGVSTVTDQNGAFFFENVEPGEYRLQGDKAGFVRTTYGSRSQFSMGSTIRVTEGGEVKDLVFKITPAGIISGRIVDEDGEPIESAQVNPLRRQVMNGSVRWVPAGNSATNDRGEFRVGSLPPGRYFVSVTLNRFGPAGPSGPVVQGKEEFAYVRTYFPGVDSIDQAQAISLQPGQEVGGVQLALRKVRVFRARGRFAGKLNESGGPRASIQVREKNSTDFMNSLMLGGVANGLNPKDGTFDVGNLRPGSYRLLVMEFDGRPKVIGATELVVGNDNVEGIVIPALPSVTIAGRIALEPDPAAKTLLDLKSIRIQLMPSDISFGFTPPINVNEDGTFKADGITPDSYRINVIAPGFSYVKSMTAGGRDIRYSPLDVSTGVDVEILLSRKVAQLGGTVEKARPESSSGVVVSENTAEAEGGTGNGRFTGPASVNQNGAFQFSSLPPGEYRLYAFEDLDFMAASDREFLKKFHSKATLVKIAEGESKSVTLKQIPASDIDEAMKN